MNKANQCEVTNRAKLGRGIFAALLALAFALAPLTACSTKKNEDAIEQEMRGSFNYLWECVQTDEDSDGYGLVWDKSNNSRMASTATTGFALAAIPVAIERGYITREQGRERVEGTLTTLERISQMSGQYYEGFFYHFIDTQTGTQFGTSEVSVIDTALLIAGAIVAGEYFGDEIKERADALYAAVNWNFYRDSVRDMFYMGYRPNAGGFSGHWDVYGEQLIMYVLAAGAPNPDYRITSSTYYAFNRMKGNYKGNGEYIYSWFNSLFTYQFSHIFVDFSDIVDRDGVNWFNNSVTATRTHYQYAVNNSTKFKTYSNKSWGFTASEGPDGYNAEFYVPPAQDRPTSVIAPSAAVASMPFSYDLSVKALKHYQTIDKLNDEHYGLLDAYDLDRDWYCSFAVGLNKGNTLLMIANAQDGMIWQSFMQNEYIQNALDVLEFTVA